MADLEREGKVRWIGLSNVSVDEIEQARSDRADPHRAEPAQPVLQGGPRLGGRRALRPPRARLPGLQPDGRRHGSTSSSLTTPSWHRWPPGLGASPHAIVLAWVMSKSATIIPIPSARQVEHALDSVTAAGLKLSEEDLAAIDEADFSQGLAYCHRISVAPTVNPAPTATNTTRSPRWILPRASASCSASGIVAAVVFP